MNIVEVIRGLVRPVVTVIATLALAIILVYLVFNYSNLDMAKDVLSAFLVLAASVIGYWFGQRKSNGG